MLLRLLLAAATLAACQRGPNEQQAVARNLERALATASAEPADTAAQRKQDELEKCKYVYHDEQGLRECLVVQNKWAPQDAAREIAIYKAEISRTVDSLERVRDSLVQEEIRDEQRRRDSLYRLRDRLDGPDARTYPDSGPWMADDRTRMYYRTTCGAARRIPVRHRVYFTTEEDAKAAALLPSGQPGCRFANRRQQFKAESIAAAPESAQVQRERWDSAVAADSAFRLR
jgi:hypothetical protein